MRYMGGKYRLRKRILATIESDGPRSARWVEPFCGAAWVTKLAPHTERYASDANPDVILYWQAIQGGWVPPTRVTEEDYRAAKASIGPSAYRAHVLINCSFGGRYASGYARGRGENYAEQASRRDSKDARLLEGVTFAHHGYADAPVRMGDTVYCDPPYAGAASYGATGKFDTDAFWGQAKAWADLGAHVYVSEYSAPADPQVRLLWEASHARSIRASDGGRTVEKLYAVIGKDRV